MALFTTLKRLVSCQPRVSALGAFVLLTLSNSAYALPDGATVTHGNVTIGGSGQQMTVQQTTQQAIINWNGFSIAGGELVKFLQPSQVSAILNRVTGVDPSIINGILQANGQVFLINPNGVLIGPGGQVSASGFLASTLNVSDADFLSGQMTFVQDPRADMAAVVNQGNIHVSDGGFVVLTAPSVSNEGVILARAGEIKLGAGTQASVNFDGQGLVNYALDLQGAAPEGTMVLSRTDTNNLLAQAVRHGGVQEAGSLSSTGTLQAGSVLMQGTNATLGGFSDTQDLTLTVAGDATLTTHGAFDGHSIRVTAGQNISFDTLTAEAQNGQGGVVNLQAGGSITQNAGGSGIAADSAELNAGTGSISTGVAANFVRATAPNGSITLQMSPAQIDGPAGAAANTGTLVGTGGTTVDAQAGGDVTINSVNSVFVDRVSGRNVSITSTTGSIGDTADTDTPDNRDIVASGDVNLRAAEFIGTVDNPIEVEIAGKLDVFAGRQIDGISGSLVGTIKGNYTQADETAGLVLLNYSEAAQSGIEQAQRGVMDNAQPGDSTVGGATLPNLFFVALNNSVDEQAWLKLLRGTLVWEVVEDEAEELDL